MHLAAPAIWPSVCHSQSLSFSPPSSSPVLKSRLNLKEPHNLLCRFRSKSDTDNDNLDCIQRPPGKDAGLPCVIDFHIEPRYAAHSRSTEYTAAQP